MPFNIKIIETAHGNLETPIFFPVFHLNKQGTGSFPKYWNEIPEMRTMLVNAHYISKSEKFKRISTKGLHNHFQFNGIFFADSGGLQSRLNNAIIDPLEILRIQEEIGADIAATLDAPVFITDNISDDKHAEYIQRTVKNALLASKNREREDMLLYAVIHGNDIKVMTNMIDYLNRKGNFNGFAIGGLILKRSNYRHLIDLILAIRKRTGEKPLHVFGLGGPAMIPLLTYLGVDSFDSSSFLSAGSNRVYFAPEQKSFAFNELPQTEMLPCVCPVCSKNSFEQVRSQRRLIGMHNLWMISYEIRKLKMHILEGDLESYLDYRFMNSAQIKIAYKYAKSKVGGFV
ncbi:tRNA-guanine transglycosylase [Methanoregula sp.]|uniref:tRNA-guanine transglycosylase n=1 Tax=Methanoregula sp. TaxID=2052170 RepID=UPI003568A309